mmetsp:Transcript_15954/g.30623  ORF Transcript_15954/g.30623 Transcript_15954/m.30623 type:complete len:303 (+) Transcript_15954:632-1540(+)
MDCVRGVTDQGHTRHNIPRRLGELQRERALGPGRVHHVRRRLQRWAREPRLDARRQPRRRLPHPEQIGHPQGGGLLLGHGGGGGVERLVHRGGELGRGHLGQLGGARGGGGPDDVGEVARGGEQREGPRSEEALPGGARGEVGAHRGHHRVMVVPPARRAHAREASDSGAGPVRAHHQARAEHSAVLQRQHRPVVVVLAGGVQPLDARARPHLRASALFEELVQRRLQHVVLHHAAEGGRASLQRRIAHVPKPGGVPHLHGVKACGARVHLRRPCTQSFQKGDIRRCDGAHASTGDVRWIEW